MEKRGNLNENFYKDGICKMWYDDLGMIYIWTIFYLFGSEGNHENLL